MRDEAMLLTADETTLLPSDDDVTFYREHGWYRSRKIIPDELLDEAMEGAHRHFRGERDWALPIAGGFSDWKPQDGDVIRNCQAVGLQNRQLRKLAMLPLLGAIAARLTGSRVIRYFDDSIVYKPAGLPQTGTVVGWHTDRAYWGTCTSDRMLTAWIPFQDTPEELGPVVYVDESHRWPGAARMRTFGVTDLADLEARFMSDKNAVHKIPMTLRRGEVSFHSCLTVHGSAENRSIFPRAALVVHMQPEDNRFRVHLDERTGKPWHVFNDDLARKLDDGTPDYTDPSVFPVMWSSSADRVRAA
jgi:Phytanoyl-CoA dioxygenase (PhyH)